MSIANLQRNLVELGRIRLGLKVMASNGKERPKKLETFRFTSAAEHLIVEIGALYGGEVKPWDGGRGKQWEVITEAALIPIYIPPQSVEPWMESWAGGVCTRRCNTERDVIHDQACTCDPASRTCKPTTRVNLLLADVPGLGVWRLESHGWWAASELTQLAELISGIKMPLPGRLLLEQRQRKYYDREDKQVKTKDFGVPVLLVDTVTSRHIQVGSDAVSQALRMGHESAALAAAQAVPAIAATPAVTAIEAAATPAIDVDRALSAIAAATTREQMDRIKSRIEQVGEPPQLVQAWMARAAQLVAQQQSQAELPAALPAALPEPPAAQQAAAPAETPAVSAQAGQDPWDGFGNDPDGTVPDGPVDEARAVQDAADEQEKAGERQEEREDALMALLKAAGKLNLNTKDVDERIAERFKTDRMGVTAPQMRQLAKELR